MRLPWRLPGREGCEELHPSGTSFSPAYGRCIGFGVTLPFWVLKPGFRSVFPTNLSPEERQGTASRGFPREKRDVDGECHEQPQQ